MNIKRFSAICLLSLGFLRTGFCQNDNFADRSPLTGNNITFTGSLAGSTVESGEPVGLPFVDNPVPVRSVWWSWTATETTPVTLIVLAYSADNQGNSSLAIYPGTNLFGLPQPVPAVSGLLLEAAFNKLSCTFQATAGQQYQLQLSAGANENPNLAVTLRLVATNPPVILEGPTDQAAPPGGSVLFKVLATGISPLAYQWRRDDVDLPGETGVMLAMDNVTTNQAGVYTVVINNSTGTVTSQGAHLYVNPSPVAAQLGVSGYGLDGKFRFSLTGESGRYYRIESSTDLAHWLPETFPFRQPLLTTPGVLQMGSVVYGSNPTVFLSSPKNTSAKFLRAGLYSPPNEICNNHLKQIKFAKELWSRELPRRSRFNVPTVADLRPYLPNILSMTCPVGGQGFLTDYTLNDLLTDPVCIIVAAHLLEEPK